MGQTALNVAAGARTRWAAISSGIWMVLILVAFAGLVGKVAMPTLAAVLVFAAIGSLRPRQLVTIWRTGLLSQTGTGQCGPPRTIVVNLEVSGP